MASGDLSAIGRQGALLVARDPILGMKAFLKQFGFFNKQETFDALNESIVDDPLYKLAKRAGLALSELGSIMGEREERFRSSLAEKFPLVLRSERAYVGTLNYLRFESFKRMVRDAQRMGLNPTEKIQMAEQMADLINNSSGRAKLGYAEPVADFLNTFFFSPRLWLGRIKMINPLYHVKNPLVYTNLDPFVRREANKTMINFISMASTVAFLGALASGGEVGLDPYSSDFGKLKIGSARIDLFGGYQQPIRLLFQVFGGKTVSSKTGKPTFLNRGYKPKTKKDIISQYVGYKEAPVISLITDYLSMSETGPFRFKIDEKLKERFTYMFMQDMYDIIQDDPVKAPLGLLAVFGIGVQTY